MHSLEQSMSIPMKQKNSTVFGLKCVHFYRIYNRDFAEVTEAYHQKCSCGGTFNFI